MNDTCNSLNCALPEIGYLVASILFIMGLKKLGHPRTAPTGNLYGAMGMLLAVIVTIAQMDFGATDTLLIIGAGLGLGALIGYVMAVRVQMTGMPEMVALFNGFGGAASALVAASEVFKLIDSGEWSNLGWLAVSYTHLTLPTKA